jgi:glyoxylase-like metal-dependent hydrolase (beta-lactamase superfamily II)
MTKVEVTKEDEITHQLSSHQIDPSEIKHIIITHFHADHVGGLKDFPNAKIYASSTAIEHTIALGKTFSFTKGVLKDLLPDDLADRIVKIDQECPEASDQIFGTTYDLFDDNTIQIIPLPGHAAGQVGLMLQTIKSKYFLIADACWLKQSIEEKTLPNPIVKLFFHSWTDFKKSLEKIQLYHQQFPETIIVPTHCQESTRTLVSDKINFDVL